MHGLLLSRLRDDQHRSRLRAVFGSVAEAAASSPAARSDRKRCAELRRVLRPGGELLFATTTWTTRDGRWRW